MELCKRKKVKAFVPVECPPKLSADSKMDERPKYYDFDQQQIVAQIGETAFRNYMRHLQREGTILSCCDVTDNPQYQSQDIDFVVTLPDRSRVGWEVKCDTYTTGNLFAETQVNSYSLSNTGDITSTHHAQGWLYKSRADMIFYFFSKWNIAYLFPRAELCLWLDKTLSSRGKRYGNVLRMSAAPNKSTRDRNCIYFGVGLLVPLSMLETDLDISRKIKKVGAEYLTAPPKFIIPQKSKIV